MLKNIVMLYNFMIPSPRACEQFEIKLSLPLVETPFLNKLNAKTQELHVN